MYAAEIREQFVFGIMKRSMSLIPTVFELIAAVSGLVALVARFPFEPLYSFLVWLIPPLRDLQKARESLNEGRSIKIDDKQETLEMIHQVAAEEYDDITARYTPVEFKWFHQGLEFRYAEQRREGKRNIPDIQDEMVGYFDERISAFLGRIAYVGGGATALGFLLSLIFSNLELTNKRI